MKEHYTLMLDLEGVVFGTDNKDNFKNPANIRPYAQFFLDEVDKLFDEFYLNTCVKNRDTPISYSAQYIMEKFFSKTNYKYYEWNKREGKISNYHLFENTTIIHLEDGIGSKGQEQINKTKHHYIPIKHWGLYHAYNPNAELKREEVFGLLESLEKIKKIMKK